MREFSCADEESYIGAEARLFLRDARDGADPERQELREPAVDEARHRAPLLVLAQASDPACRTRCVKAGTRGLSLGSPRGPRGDLDPPGRLVTGRQQPLPGASSGNR